MAELSLRMSDGPTLIVPASLKSITSYVLLEQETWFEKELAFVRCWLKPGMTAIDVGANLGVYSLAMAMAVGPQGRIFAYEPASETRDKLSRSCTLNNLGNVVILGTALSDAPRRARLVFGNSSELNALGDSDIGEDVDVTTLDRENVAHGWPTIDFMKIDAEGEEERIIAGGAAFFAQHSPLVMFEVKAGATVNMGLLREFTALGFCIFRLLDGDAVLVPVSADTVLDDHELNLFAARPRTVSMLAANGLLVEGMGQWTLTSDARSQALARLGQLPFASAFKDAFARGRSSAHSPYFDGLAAFSMWRNRELPVADRFAALTFACDAFEDACRQSRSVPRLSSFARACWEAGFRGKVTAILVDLVKDVMGGAPPPGEPFWPASPRHDLLSAHAAPGAWFMSAAIEQIERMVSFSTFFVPSPRLDWLCGTPFASAEMLRRSVLQQAAQGRQPVVPDKLRVESSDHLNAAVWAAGEVPGTVLRN